MRVVCHLRGRDGNFVYATVNQQRQRSAASYLLDGAWLSSMLEAR